MINERSSMCVLIERTKEIKMIMWFIFLSLTLLLLGIVKRFWKLVIRFWKNIKWGTNFERWDSPVKPAGVDVTFILILLFESPEKYEADNELSKVREKLFIMLFMSILHIMTKFTCQEKFLYLIRFLWEFFHLKIFSNMTKIINLYILK
jgi:hypothetical protein